jgi:hypothetical protein
MVPVKKKNNKSTTKEDNSFYNNQGCFAMVNGDR